MNNLIVTEGVEGYWHYHLSHEQTFTKSLCGKQTMPTHLSLKQWGIVTHLRERYCKDCKELASKLAD